MIKSADIWGEVLIMDQKNTYNNKKKLNSHICIVLDKISIIISNMAHRFFFEKKA